MVLMHFTRFLLLQCSSTFKSDYLHSSDWNVNKVEAEKRILPEMNNTLKYAVLAFTIYLDRKIVFSSYILTLPCVFLACLTLVVFWLPPDRPDRTALGNSISVIIGNLCILILILRRAYSEF